MSVGYKHLALSYPIINHVSLCAQQDMIINKTSDLLSYDQFNYKEKNVRSW